MTNSEHTTATITAARERDALLTIHGYCRACCPAREVEIWVKDYDDELVPLVTTRGLRCPLCGTPLAVHFVQTAAEQRREYERLARCSVNAQRYRRDHGPVMPLRARLDDSLPGEAFVAGGRS